MGKRRLRVSTSSEDEDDEPKQEEKKQKKPPEDEVKQEGNQRRRADKKGGAAAWAAKEGKDDVEQAEEEEEEEEGQEEEAKPIGDVVRVSGKGKKKRKHFKMFEYDGNQYELEDPVLLAPEDKSQKPYVAILKDITQEIDGTMNVTGQWFYRPEEAEKKGGGSWQSKDSRELFYSFHLDEVPAESVMHKCVVHFVPLNKKLPLRSQNPGFIVQKVYDAVEKKLWKLTDKDYEDNKQHEIDLLVQKTIKRIGELLDIEPEDIPADHADQTTSKRSLRRKNMNPIDVSRTDDTSIRSEHLMKAETPGSCTSEVSEYHVILSNFNALTGDPVRDKWSEKLLEGIQAACNLKQDALAEVKQTDNAVSLGQTTNCKNGAGDVISSRIETSESGEGSLWPEAAVQAVTALEKASHEALGSDFQKYNKKMRQLVFNLKNTVLLANRLLRKELDPVVVVNMTPNELKDGLTADERTTTEPEESKRMQMTDARCSRCSEKEVGVADIIHAGGHGDRYQLECMACGHTWYSSRDAISTLTIDTPTVVGNVGTAPWATAKFEDVEKKKLVSPRDHEKPAVDIFQKSTAAYMPVLETQKSFNRLKTEDSSVRAASRE